jgi:hypothetical protein
MVAILVQKVSWFSGGSTRQEHFFERMAPLDSKAKPDKRVFLVKLCMTLLQRLASGRLILHLIITKPPPMFPSLKKTIF